MSCGRGGGVVYIMLRVLPSSLAWSVAGHKLHKSQTSTLSPATPISTQVVSVISVPRRPSKQRVSCAVRASRGGIGSRGPLVVSLCAPGDKESETKGARPRCSAAAASVAAPRHGSRPCSYPPLCLTLTLHCGLTPVIRVVSTTSYIPPYPRPSVSVSTAHIHHICSL